MHDQRVFEAQISTVNFGAPTGPAPEPGRDLDLSNQGNALGLSAQGQGGAQREHIRYWVLAIS